MKVDLSRRQFLKLTGFSVASLALTACNELTVNNSPTQKPNIILIMADDLGYECIGANGSKSYKTPVLDRMAATGIRFEHCYAQPLCTPSRVQIMTGIYNVRNYLKFGVLKKDQATFAHLLKNNCYKTCIAGKWQLGKQPDSPAHFGFDQWCLWQLTKGRIDKQGRDTRYTNPTLDINGKLIKHTNGQYGPDVASDFICDFIQNHKQQPFFVYYPMILTHCPFVPTPDSPDWNPEDNGSKEYKGNEKYFPDMVAYTDKIVGKIINKLDQLGLTDNTLILFTGDNGTDTPVVSNMNGQQVAGAKGKTTDAGTRVPLIASWPAAISPAQVSDELIDFSDFLPTICHATRTKIPEELNIDGRSFLPQLKGSNAKRRDWIYCWYSRNGDDKKAKVFARNHRYKLYRNGKMHDIDNDVLEKKPLNDRLLDSEQKQIKAMLQETLDKHTKGRIN